MLLFTQILTERESGAKANEKRRAERFAVGPAFPIQTSLTLRARDPERNVIPDPRRTQAWGARLVNLSEIGASVYLSTAAVAQRGEECQLKLSLGRYVIEVPGTVVHFRILPQYTSCGIAFNFPKEETRRSYLQLLEPVKMGASLTRPESKAIKPDVTGLLKEEYEGKGASKLVVWRPGPNTALQGFDFQMNRYGIRWTQGMNALEPYGRSRTPANKNSEPPLVALTPPEIAEVRWLFCLAVPNLSKAVAVDVRKFLATLVT